MRDQSVNSFSSNTHYSIQALVLAAGASKRFNDVKQLTLIEHTPMIMHVLKAFQLADFDNVKVVLGANASMIKHVLPSGTDTLTAEHWQNGMGMSIAEGVKTLSHTTTHVFIGLADQIDVTTAQCNRIVSKSRQHPDKIVAAFYNSKLGAPAIFPKHYFTALASLSDDKGARDILRANHQQILSIDMPEAAIDIDTKTDLASYRLKKN